MRSGLAAMAALSALCCSTANGQVVVSQIYGGASAAGSTYTRDFVELFNRGTTTVNLSTYSLQYAATTGTTWTKVNLTGSIAPGSYYLFLGATGTSGVAPPVADLSGTLDLASTTGKVALVANQTVLTAGQAAFAPGTNGVVDFVGYGATTNGFEGGAATGVNLSTILSVKRLNGGCTDDNNNFTDFAAPATPLARNSASPANVCATLTGACCLASGECRTLSATACATAGGTYGGNFTLCTAGTYTMTSNAVAFDDLTTQTVGRINLTTAQADDASQAVQLTPFPFFYFGSPIVRYSVNSNGWAAFYAQASATNYGTGETIPAIAVPNMITSVYRRDLNGTGKNCWQLVKGTAPNRQLVIQWDQYVPFGFLTTNTFELILNESTNVIEYRYATLNAGVPNVCGLEEVSGTVGVLVPNASVISNASFQFTPIGECPVIGACCNAGACTSGDAVGCLASGGIFSGPGSSCNPNPCATGACCLPNGTCAAQTAGQCAGNSGVYQGDNAICGAIACPASGSCCVATACTVGFQANCTGVFTAAGVCSPNPCATPCCDASTAACTLVATTGGTCNGTLGTAGATCAATVCPSGACCNTTTFVCSVTGPSGCAFTYAGTGTTCTTNPCPAPANDLCANAAVLSGSGPFPLQTLGQNNSSTDTTAFAPAVCASSSRDVWYSFTPTSGALSYTFTTCNSVTQTGNGTGGAFDTVLSIHSACPITGANNLQTGLSSNCNDDSCTGGIGASTIAGLTLTAGQTYLIRVARFSTGTGGTFRLDIITEPYGACCSSTSTCILSAQSACTGTNVFVGGGTLCNTAGICNGACCVAATGVCTFTTAASCTGVHGGVGSACTTTFCPTTTCCNDATGACTTTGTAACPAGTTNNGTGTCTASPCRTTTCCNTTTGACTVTGTAACPAGTTANAATTCSPQPCPQPTACCTAGGCCTLAFAASCIGTSGTALSCTPNPCSNPPPANDACAGATSIAINSGIVAESCLATAEVGDVAGTCTAGTFASMWWSFTAPYTGTFTASTCGSSYDTVLVAFSGTCAALTQVGCNDDTCGLQSTIATLAFTAGQTYFIRVGSFGTTTGTINLIVTGNNPAGSCCASSGSCTLTDAAACTSGTWTAAGTCTPNTCPQPGTCCDNAQVCTFGLPAACTGTFSAGGSCTPNPCTPPGVCCRGSTCTTAITTAAACAASITSGTAGSNFPTGTLCNGVPVSNSPCCYGDYNKVNGITVADIFNFLSDWFAGEPYANVGGSGAPATLTVQNIFDFLANWFAGGC